MTIIKTTPAPSDSIGVEATYDNKPVIVHRVGIVLTLIEYRDIFRGQLFHVATNFIEGDFNAEDYI